MPLRKMIVDIPERKLKRLTKALQETFVDLITAKSSISAEEFLKQFYKTDDIPIRQQDIHEFMISFFTGNFYLI